MTIGMGGAERKRGASARNASREGSPRFYGIAATIAIAALIAFGFPIVIGLIEGALR